MQKSGFTLIEISIVLIIIGLIAAGILIGRDLIHQAELRADISKMRDLDVAVQTFKLKYNCLPGDCPNATDFLDNTVNGDGNDVIGLQIGSGGAYSMMLPSIWNSEAVESIVINDHLARAKLINFEPFDTSGAVDLALVSPSKVLQRLKSQSEEAGMIVGCKLAWLGELEGCHHLLLGVTNRSMVGLGTKPAVIPIPDAFYFDSKLDDGVALTGGVISANSTDPIENQPQFIITTAGNSTCVDYNFTSTDKCVLMVKRDF